MNERNAGRPPLPPEKKRERFVTYLNKEERKQVERFITEMKFKTECARQWHARVAVIGGYPEVDQ